MSPDRHDRPLQSGLSGSGSTSTGSSSKDASNEAGRAGETGVDAPQFEWVYNSDHTDTVNFGYMFLKPVGTRPTLASGPAHIPVLKPPTIQVISKPRTQNELHLPVTIPPTRDNIIRQSSQSLSPDSGASSSSPAQSDQFQPFGRAPQTLSGSSSQQRASTSQNIPYRSDRGYGKSTNTSQEQFTAPNLQWQQNQDSPISLNSSSTPIHNTPLNLQDNHRRDSLDHSGYIASATPIITPEAFIRPTLPPRNEKRKARNSPILSHSMNPISTTTSFQPIIRKRRLLNPQHSKGTVFATNLSLCTRCQQYQIPGSEPGLCTSCVQETNIYKWPSISGTRMESLESLVLFLVPSHMEECLLNGTESVPRGRSWRPLAYKIPHTGIDLNTLVFQDQWTLSKQQTRSIGLFGEDYEELADIAQTYQRSLLMRNICLEAACTTLIAVCDLYKCIIAPPNTSGIISTTPIAELISHIRTVRITMLNAFRQLEFLASSPSTTRSRQDWLPAFLSATILSMAAIIFLDVLGQFPSPYREQVWGSNWHNRIVEMRRRGYGVLLNLMKANTNGVNPLKLDCWKADAGNGKGEASPSIISTPSNYNQPFNPRPRHQGIIAPVLNIRPDKIEPASYFWEFPGILQSEQDVLLGFQSPAALQGLIALKAWQLKYDEHLKHGQNMFAKELYALALIRPIAGLAKIFDI